MKRQSKFISIGLIGDSLVGKTKLLHQYLYKKFKSVSYQTISLSILTKQIDFYDQYPPIRETIKFFDIPGLLKYQKPFSISKKLSAIILVYDVSNKFSFYSLDYWVEQLEKVIDLTSIPVIIIGNRIDLDRMISKEDAKEFASSYNFKYFEASALTGKGVDYAFDYIVYKTLKRMPNQLSIVLEQKNKKINNKCYM